jgi:Restriction endonuclease
MNDRMPLEQQFQAPVGQSYEALGYRVVAQGGAMDKGYDFTFTDPDGKLGIIEVKLYRTRIIQRQLVVRAAEVVEAIRILAKKDQGILVLGSRLNLPIVNVGSTAVVDMAKLMEMAAKSPALATQLESIARRISPMPVSYDADILAARTLGDAYNAPSEIARLIDAAVSDPRAMPSGHRAQSEPYPGPMRNTPSRASPAHAE